ncbi:MAG: hydantoinase B/oxoprolinase family protein [Devosia sp.]|nr:hydantoinase B/oxoprolinase family protein [Devosia sp.]
MSAETPSAGELDLLTMIVLQRSIESCCREMSNALLRSGRAGIINTAFDFSCTFVDRAFRTVSTSVGGLPLHLNSIDLIPRAVVKKFGDGIEAGDCFANNSGYMGNTHCADLTLCSPVVVDGTLLGYAVARAHLSDIGFSTPTTYNPTAADVYQEGLILPCIRVQRDYRDIPDVLDLCKANIRVPDHFYGDYLAILAAVRVGQRRIGEICGKHGTDVFLGFMDQYQLYAERMARQAIRALPAGEVRKELLYDPIVGYPEGFPVRVRIEVDPAGELVTVDLTDNEDSLPLGINLTEAIALGACRQGVFVFLGPEVPRCTGAFDRVRILLREGAAIGLPRYPSATPSSTTDLCHMTMAAIHEGMADLGHGLGMAGSSVGIPASAGVVSGFDSSRGRYFVNQLLLGHWGGPALSGHDGWFTYGTSGSAGGLMQSSVEITERQQPLYVERMEIRPDSGGAGTWEGAPGSECVLRPLRDALRVMTNSASRVFPPRGVVGGGKGGAMCAWVENAEGERMVVPSAADVTIMPGGALISTAWGEVALATRSSALPNWCATASKRAGSQVHVPLILRGRARPGPDDRQAGDRSRGHRASTTGIGAGACRPT